ncbi:MAG: HDIG domain-containing metalloprotein [Leptospirales bacterium]
MIQKTDLFEPIKNIAEVFLSASFLTGTILFTLFSIFDAIHSPPNEYESINKTHLIPVLTVLLLVPVILDLTLWSLLRGWISSPWHSSTLKSSLFAIPAITSSVLGTMLLGQRMAVGVSVCLGVLFSLLEPNPSWLWLFVLVGSIFGSKSQVLFRGRLGLVQSAGLIGILLFILNGAIHVWEEPLAFFPSLQLLSVNVAGSLLSILSAILLLPILEKGFGVLSDTALTELLDVNHPLLRELYWKAPGSYQHSMALSYLSEAAALAIGENTKLARVSAYYHDIGKMDRPQYFIENQATYNRHELLTPRMSALILIDHVRRGMELARKHHLPEVVVNAIPEHHGTRLMQFFYRKAFEQDPDSGHPTQDSDFRYPGPKPHSKITAIIMLADAVEASSRVLQRHHPTPARIRGMVEEVTTDIIKDGQLDEAPLSLAELALIRNTFTHILVSIYHHRVPYPKAFPTPSPPKDQDSKKTIHAN